jgi:hypothetical protein
MFHNTAIEQAGYEMGRSRCSPQGAREDDMTAIGQLECGYGRSCRLSLGQTPIVQWGIGSTYNPRLTA